MFPHDKQTQETFLNQECYLPILAQTFLTARKAEGLSKGALHFYREKLKVFLAYCDAQAVTQIQDVTPDFLRRFMLKLAETHNPGGQHAFYRAMRAFLRFTRGSSRSIRPASINRTCSPSRTGGTVEA